MRCGLLIPGCLLLSGLVWGGACSQDSEVLPGASEPLAEPAAAPAPPPIEAPPPVAPAQAGGEAWRERCEELDDHLLELNRTSGGEDKLEPAFAIHFVAACREEYSAEKLDCLLSAKTEDEAFACNPELL